MQVDALAARPGGVDAPLHRFAAHERHERRQSDRGLGDSDGGSYGGNNDGRRFCRSHRPALAAQLECQRRCRLRRCEIELVAQRVGVALIVVQGADRVAQRGAQANHLQRRRLVAAVGGPALPVQCQCRREIAALFAVARRARQQVEPAPRQLFAPAQQPEIELGAADAIEPFESRAAHGG